MSAIQSLQVDGGSATIAWTSLYDLLTFSGVPAIPIKVRELAIQNRDGTSKLHITTSRADGTAPGVTSADFLRTIILRPQTATIGESSMLWRANERSINTKEILLACNTNDGVTTCTFSASTTGV